MKHILAIACASLLTFPAFGANWCHETHTAADNSKLEMHYQVDTYFSRFRGLITQRKNVWLHLSQNTLQGQERVRWVVLNVRNLADGSRFEEPKSLQIDASYDVEHQRFTAPVNSFYMPIHDQFDGDSHQEIAVVVDGRWLKQPNSALSNFVFAAQDSTDFCANPY